MIWNEPKLKGGLANTLAILLPAFGLLGAPLALAGRPHVQWTKAGIACYPLALFWLCFNLYLAGKRREWAWIDGWGVWTFFLQTEILSFFLLIVYCLAWVLLTGRFLLASIKQTSQARHAALNEQSGGQLLTPIARLRYAAWTPIIGGLGFSWRADGRYGIGWAFMALGWLALFPGASRLVAATIYESKRYTMAYQYRHWADSIGDPFTPLLYVYLFAWIALFLVELIRYLVWKRRRKATEGTSG